MRKTAGRIAVAALIGSTPLQAQDTGVLVLKPSSNWHLDYGKTRCRIGRTFGTEDTPSLLWLEQAEPSSGFRWLIAGEALKQISSRRGVIATFEPGFAPMNLDDRPLPEFFRVEGVKGAGNAKPAERARQALADNNREELTLKGFGEVLTDQGYGFVDEMKLEPGKPQALTLDVTDGAKIDYVELERAGRRVRLATGNLEAVFKAMNECTRDLYRSWGITIEEVAQVSTGPLALNGKDLASKIAKNYPSTAEVRREEARMTLKVIVGVDGKVERCIRIDETIADNFPNTGCELYQAHARFAPATNAAGEPVRGIYSIRLTYMMN